MILKQSLRSRVIHVPECQFRGEDQTWPYGRYIPDVTSLSAHTKAFPRMHACPKCLPGVCRCRSCG